MFKSEKGVSAVEFALIAPLLFVLTFGIIEFGVVLFDKAVVTNASREGARKAILFNKVGDDYSPFPASDVIDVVNRYTSNYLISLGSTATPSIDVQCIDVDHVTEIDPPCVEEGDVIVTVGYTYDFLVFPNLVSLLGSSFDGTIDLTGTTRMRME